MSDALLVKCPDCEQRKNKPCVYLPPKNWDGTPLTEEQMRRTKSPQVLQQIARMGQPTTKPHNGRIQKAYWKGKAEEQKARERAYAEANSVSPDRAAILAANGQAIKDEQEQLISWLREHGRILIG